MMNAADEDLVHLVRRAEHVVASVESDALRPVAFSEVLRFLLVEGARSQGASTRRPALVARTTSQPRKGAAGTAGRILSLRDEGFFEKPKTISETQAELRTRGFPYPVEALSTPLVRLVRQRALRRLERRDGAKRVFEYCNP